MTTRTALLFNRKIGERTSVERRWFSSFLGLFRLMCVALKLPVSDWSYRHVPLSIGSIRSERSAQTIGRTVSSYQERMGGSQSGTPMRFFFFISTTRESVTGSSIPPSFILIKQGRLLVLFWGLELPLLRCPTPLFYKLSDGRRRG